MLYAKFLERYAKWQFLHQIAVAHQHEGDISAGAFCQGHIGAEGQVSHRHAAFLRYLSFRNIQRFNGFIALQLLHLERHIVIQQTADTDNDDRAMGEDVT